MHNKNTTLSHKKQPVHRLEVGDQFLGWLFVLIILLVSTLVYQNARLIDKFPFEPHLLLHTVSSVHVLDVVKEVTDWVHVTEMPAVLIHRLEHLIEGHPNLKHTQKTRIYEMDVKFDCT